jgi:pimeloyl-ACP methyl ester carboxylesterase
MLGGRWNRRNEPARWRCAWISLLALVIGNGCASKTYLAMREIRENTLTTTLDLVGRGGPQPSPRTSTMLRRFDLESKFKTDPEAVLATLSQPQVGVPHTERTYAVAELAYILGKRAERTDDRGAALSHYNQSLTSSYNYLFGANCAQVQNPYDPQFRGACDLYNEALEDTLRILQSEGRLRPGESYTIEHDKKQHRVATLLRGKWRPQDIERLEFVSDYKLQKLNNRHLTYGLGVPLVAVRKEKNDTDPNQRYYPDGLSFAVTALLRVVPGADQLPYGQRPPCLVEFFDPIDANELRIDGHWVPIQTDLTTPLAFFLDNPEFNGEKLATIGLLNPARTETKRGIYMLEPFDPNRIPVVMVHGLWSSPYTFMDMFNDLRSFPEIRDNYQFWFYLYPTGQPFWVSAAQLRSDLAQVRRTFDRNRQVPTLDEMVLVGHSMGGLLSRLQVTESGDDFLRIITDKPIEQLKISDEDRTRLASTIDFRANESVKRVITIGTPHRGSDFSNSYTQWLGRRFIRLPNVIRDTGSRIVGENEADIKNADLLTMNTSIDSLAPESPIFPVLLRAKTPPGVRFHNIVGVVDQPKLLGGVVEPGDGVVSLASSHLDPAQCDSEIEVRADHTTIHTTPQAILEVRRVLALHLDQAQHAIKLARQQSNAR